MKATDRTIVFGLLILGLIAAFWFVLLSPKREQAGELQDQVAELEATVSEQEQLVASAEAARDDFDRDYRQLVVLGKAVPEDDDTSSLFVQLDEIARRSSVDFEAIELSQGAGSSAASLPAAAQTTAGTAPPPAEGAQPAPAAQTASVPATEAAAATVPIGATVGPAGLPVMPYKLDLHGSFFELADFLAEVDRLVSSRHGRPLIDGRLMTIDGFGLSGNEETGFETLDATLAVTTFIVPAEQGLTAGASEAGPALDVPDPAAPTPASTTTTTPPMP